LRAGSQAREQWGYDISEGSVVIRWIKLGLGLQDPEQELKALSRLTDDIKKLSLSRPAGNEKLKVEGRGHLSKQPAEVLYDYLDKMINRWCQEYDGIHTLANVPVDVVITHPAVSQRENLVRP
jgi:hypothetical protein